MQRPVSSRPTKPRPPARRSRSNPWLWALAVAGVALVVVIVVALTRSRGGGQAQAAIGQPVPPDVLAAVTQVPPAAWNTAGAKDAQPPIAVSSASGAKVAAPQALYIGAEYCPYCAAERWSLIVALSRFGSFDNLRLTASSATDIYPNTATFTLRGVSYSSPYVRLEAVETAGRTLSNGRYPTLDSPNPTQMALFQRYNAPPYVSAQNAGGIPFLLIGESYLWVGAPHPLAQFQGKSWQDIASGLASPQDDVSRSILANANMLTAAICKLNGGNPDSVCANPGVQAAAQLLSAPGAR